MIKAEPYDSVVLSGGGSKGFAQLGELVRYHEAGLLQLNKVKVFAGTSIGSMIALLMNCGYTPIEIFKELHAIKSLFNVNQSHSVWDILSKFGLTSIDTFSRRIEEMVKRKYSGRVPTLEELYQLTGQHLIIIATNVSNMKKAKAVLTHITEPRLRCTDAMKMSCNLPLLFTRIKYKGCYYVDGGLVCNVPLSEIPKDCKRTLCIVTMGTNSTITEKECAAKYNYGSSEHMNFMQYFCRLVLLPINQITKLDCQVQPRAGATLTLNVMTFYNVPVLDFTMSDDEKMNMFVLGYERATMEIEKTSLYVKNWGEDEVMGSAINTKEDSTFDQDSNRQSNQDNKQPSNEDSNRENKQDGWEHEKDWDWDNQAPYED